VIANVHESMWEKFDSVILLIVQKLFGISIKFSIKLISIQFAETSVRKVMFICTVKKVETMYAQNMLISYLHCNDLHFVGELVAMCLKTKVLEKHGYKYFSDGGRSH